MHIEWGREFVIDENLGRKGGETRKRELRDVCRRKFA